MIERLFSTPIFIHDFEPGAVYKIHSEIEQALPKIQEQKSKSLDAGSVVSTFKFNSDEFAGDIDRFDLKILKEALTEAAHAYAYSIGYKGSYLKLDGSWFNFFEPGDFYYDHIHPGVKVAGVYYYKTTGVDGNIRFTNPNPHMHFGNWPADGLEEECIYYPPKVGRVMLWPAWMSHRVEINQGSADRISIGVNFI